MNTIKADKVYFPGLDGIRYIAFLLVFFQHSLQAVFDGEKPSTLKWAILEGFFRTGEEGIAVFFVLSGFLITYLLLKEKEVKSKINIGSFYIRRILRIWPLFYVVLAFGFLVYPYLYHLMGHNVKIYNSVFYNILFLNNFDFLNLMKSNSEHVFPIISVTWSIGIEEQFYLTWPLLIYLTPKRGQLPVLCTLMLGSLMFRLWHYNDGLILYFHSFALFGDLILGGIIAYFAFNSQKFRDFFKYLSAPGRIAFYAGGIVIFLLRNIIFQYTYGAVVCRLVLTLFFAFVILEQSFNESRTFKLSNNRFFSKWGKYTYGLYLLHRVALWMVSVLLDKYKFFPYNGFCYLLALAVLGFILSMMLSYISYQYFESFFLRLKQKFGSLSGGEIK